LLKLDIEGAEYEVLEGLDLPSFHVKIVCIEFHNNHGVYRTYKAIRDVCSQGYQVVATNRMDVTFAAAGML
jgi:hypothetical protein